jgi:hypothetical protein
MSPGEKMIYAATFAAYYLHSNHLSHYGEREPLADAINATSFAEQAVAAFRVIDDELSLSDEGAAMYKAMRFGS